MCLLLLGNSYADPLYPGLEKNSRLKHHAILSIGTCDPALARALEFTAEMSPDIAAFDSAYEIRDGAEMLLP